MQVVKPISCFCAILEDSIINFFLNIYNLPTSPAFALNSVSLAGDFRVYLNQSFQVSTSREKTVIIFFLGDFNFACNVWWMLTSENSIERNFNRDDDCELNQILDQGEHVCSNKFDLTLSCADDLPF